MRPQARLSVYRQDAAVSGPSEVSIDQAKVGRRLQGPRVAVVVGRGDRRAYADADGNYLYEPSNSRFDLTQAFVSSQNTLDLFQDYADRKIDWSFGREELAVIPHAGEGKNAIYTRWNKSINFSSFNSRHLKKRVHTSQSADVVSHETGHALLDGMKPEYGKTFDRETKATHEAFGDCAAILLAISRPENRRDALSATDGDLRQGNCIAHIAEEFGTAVRLDNRNPHDDKPYLRNPLNNFTYVDPATLPRNGPRDTLSAEAHSFCEIFTRAFYDAVVNVHESLTELGLSPDESLAQAGSVLGHRLTQGMTMAAPNKARFKDVALAMLRADELAGGSHFEAISKSFLKTEILTAEDMESLKAPLPQGSDSEVLQQLGLSQYESHRLVTDDKGRQTQEFLLKEERQVLAQQLWGDTPLLIDVTGGLSVTRDRAGQVIHIAHMPPDSKDEETWLPGPVSLMTGTPEARMLPTETGYKLERLPVFAD